MAELSRRLLGSEAVHSVTTFIQHKPSKAPQCANHHAKADR